MPKAPAKEQPQPNPYIGKSISKSLLTPCRRIGLPRKKPTPTNSVATPEVKPIVQEPTSTSTPISTKTHETESKIEDTPKEITNTTKKDKKKVSRQLPLTENKNLDTPIKNNDDKLPNHDTSLGTDLLETSASNLVTSSPIKDNKKTTNKKSKKTKENRVNNDPKLDKSDNTDIKKDISNSHDNSAEDFNDSKNVETKRKTSRPAKEETNTAELTKENSPNNSPKKPRKSKISKVILDDDDEEVVTTKRTRKPAIKDYSSEDEKEEIFQKKTPKKSMRKRGKQAANDSTSTVDDLISPSKKKPKISVNINESPVEKKSPPLLSPQTEKPDPLVDNKSPPILSPQVIRPKPKTKPIYRSLSLKKSSEESVKCTSSSSVRVDSPGLDMLAETCSAISNLPEKVKSLQKEVQEKELLLENLKQAEVYNNLHNIDELKGVTDKYKSACMEALNDLTKLDSRYELGEVLKNLNVPESMIKLTSNGDLV